MTSYLNAYHNFIDITTKDGQALLSNATDKFESPLIGDNKISLRPGEKDYQRFEGKLNSSFATIWISVPIAKCPDSLHGHSSNSSCHC